MKKTLIALLAALLLILGSYYATGSRVEPVLQQWAAALTARSPGLSLSMKDKQSGLFSSRFAYALDYALPDQSRPHMPRRISGELVVDVAHGPVPVSAGVWKPCLARISTRFVLDETTDKDIRSFFDMFPELAGTTADTSLQFDMVANVALNVPSFSRTVQDSVGVPVTVDWKGMTGQFLVAPDFASLRGGLAAPGLTARGEEGEAIIEGLSADVDAKALTANLWSGRQVFRILKLAYRPPQADTVVLRDLEATVSLMPRQDVLDYSFTLAGVHEGAESAHVPGRLNLTVMDLDMKAMDELLGLLSRAPHTPEAALTPNESRVYVDALLRRSPSLLLEASALEGDARLALRCEARTEGLSTLPDEAARMLPYLRAKGDFSGQEMSLAALVCSFSPAANTKATMDMCLKHYGEAVAMLVAQGLFLKKDGRIVSQAEWNGVSLTVNGKMLN